MVQVPGARVGPQVPAARPVARENPGEKASAIPVRFALPVLRSVRVRGALEVTGVLTPTFPKLRGPPVTLAIGAAAAPANSTAPISNPVPCGRALPKKS